MGGKNSSGKNKKIKQEVSRIVQDNLKESINSAKEKADIQDKNEISTNETNATNTVIAKKLIKSKNNSAKNGKQPPKSKKDFNTWTEDSSKTLKEPKKVRPTSIKLPYAGQSYNPAKSDVDSLAEVVNKAREEEAKSKRLQTKSVLHKIPQKTLEDNLYKELTCGLIEEENSESKDNKKEKLIVHPIKTDEAKKTKTKPVSKKYLAHLAKVKVTEEKKRLVQQEIEMAKELKNLKKQLRDQPLIKPVAHNPKPNKRTVMKYGPQKFKEATPVSHRNQADVSRTLLHIKPQQDLLSECFDNVRRKGMVETRKLVKKTKQKVKSCDNKRVEEETKLAMKELEA